MSDSTSKGVALTDNAVIFGLHNTPVVVALDKNSGAVLWKATIDDYKGAVITQTPTVAGGRVYVGVSGLGEEVSATTPPHLLRIHADTLTQALGLCQSSGGMPR